MIEQSQRFAQSRLGVYSLLARRRRPKSYVGKIMFVAFLGTHIPLLTLVFFAISATHLHTSTKLTLLFVALVATLAGTGVTLLALNQLLSPIKLTFHSLRQYLERSTLPALPTGFTDEAGILMADTMHVLTKLDESIHHLKNYDSLTALPNRSLFQYRLDQALTAAKRNRDPLAVILLDLDGFSALNNSLGYEKGNLLLRQTAQRLSASVRESDVLSRVGSDEFAVLHTNIHSPQEVEAHSQRMLDALAKPLTLEGKDIYITASIGIAMYPVDEDGSDQLLANADVALRLAKESSRNSFRYYSSDMNDALRRRVELERDLRNALEREELRLYYQPQIDIHTGKCIGAEALIRWRHPKRGMVSPAEFIPAAESSGLIVPIGDWVLETACQQNKAWHLAGDMPLRVAVNLSSTQFREIELVDKVAAILRKTGHDAKYLELEITESLIMEDVQRAILMLQKLHELGVTLALDDFGTGYSSLSYLKRFPLDILKIDQSFVRGLPNDAHDAAITQAIITLAQSLELLVIAEGVETEEQKEYLECKGCYKMQGYHFGRPMPAEEFTRIWRC